MAITETGLALRNSFCECVERFRGAGNENQITMALRERTGERHSEPAGSTGYKSKAVVLHFSSCSGKRRTASENRVSNTPSQKRVVMP